MNDEEVLAGVVLMSDPKVAMVPVHECGQKLVDVRPCEVLSVSSLCEDAHGHFAQVRSGVLDRLLAAQGALPTGLRLVVVEGYRPPPLQKRYFDEYVQELRAAHPAWDEQVLYTAASRYVSPPDIAPHSAGAAVDLTLAGPDGRELDLGTRVNASPEESSGRCYTAHPGVGAEAARNRAILAEALAEAGFVNYPTEWWHWSFGDRYWAMATDCAAALYGPCLR
jgi:D-alanyl-D-alanine dipeptidase